MEIKSEKQLKIQLKRESVVFLTKKYIALRLAAADELSAARQTRLTTMRNCKESGNTLIT